MKLSKILKNGFLIVFACLALSACATSKKTTGQMQGDVYTGTCLLYTSPSPRDVEESRMPSSA